MIYSTFQGEQVSRLGFGTMRLPMKGQEIDTETFQRMVDYAMAHGLNYFDTAYPYHEGKSELALGEALKKYPRDDYYLATKYPGHQIAATYNPQEVFEEQLVKCGVDYFDFYLLHNVYENSIKVYRDEKWGIMDYFIEQKRLGRIRHLGFSCHGAIDTLREFLNLYGDHMEFCQIQLNYLDWTLQNGQKKYELLTNWKIPVWVMEPVRGGKLAHLPEDAEKRLMARRPDESIASWSFRHLMTLPNVAVILSGMSDMAQMEDNIRTFETDKPLTEEESKLLLDIAEDLKDTVPCTACRYCVAGCPKGLDIPMLLAAYNDLKFDKNFTPVMQIECLAEEKKPSACIACGACSKSCPQKIEIPETLADLVRRCGELPSWEELSRQREAAAKKLRS